jgi:AcrR family transcriptional regulator
MAGATTRLTAAERRDDVLDAAVVAFAAAGFEGTSTEDIAREAGISQPYLFRLFGTKKDLFMATVARCFRETLETFQKAAEGLRGEEALRAMGTAYMEMMLADRTRLRAQLQAYAACDDPDICEVVANGYGDLVTYVERVSGLPTEDVAGFFAKGLLLNVLSAMDMQRGPEPWARRLLEGCGKEL